MTSWLAKGAMLGACALIGVASSVTTVVVAGDRLLDVEDRIDSAVAREADAAIRASHANERERSDNVAKAFAAFVTDMDRRVTDLEGKSYRLTDLLCGTLDGQTVVTAVRLIPIGFGEQELDLTTATICVEEK
jgi:hypothetical protein